MRRSIRNTKNSKKYKDGKGTCGAEGNCTKISSFASLKKRRCEMIPHLQEKGEAILPCTSVNSFDVIDPPIPMPNFSSGSIECASNVRDSSSFQSENLMFNKTFGFIGVGTLCKIITKAFLRSGLTINVWSKLPNRFTGLEHPGVNQKHTPAEVIETSDIIFIFIPDDAIPEQHRFTAAGIFDGLASCLEIHKIYVILTTLDQETDQDMIKAIIKQGGYHFEVKVLVPLAGDENFSPIFVCAGHPKIYEEIKPYLDHVSQNIHYYGSEFGSSASKTLPSYLSQEVVLHAFNDAFSVFSRLGYSFRAFKDSIRASNLNSDVVVKRLEDFPEGQKKLSEYLSEL